MDLTNKKIECPLENSVDLFYAHLYNVRAPLTKDWFLVGKPLNLVVILASYLYFCKTLGPWYMKDKKPYKLKTVIKIYNFFQIFISLYLFYEGTRYVFFTDFNFRCQGLNDPNSPEAKQIAKAVWMFYIVKIIDLMDTVFFVLRKSNRQITQLHLHHHTLMPIVSWIAVTYIPGGQGVLVGHINSLVHAVMYTYYLIAGLGDKYKKYLWWKKYLTMLQLVQFALIGVHSTNSLFYSCANGWCQSTVPEDNASGWRQHLVSVYGASERCQRTTPKDSASGWCQCSAPEVSASGRCQQTIGGCRQRALSGTEQTKPAKDAGRKKEQQTVPLESTVGSETTS
ncbi:unnamed protein product [Euphydryas editha]|uniref:Elongation of very long chain fatty acids protein n=1 Tax=Euphydryas editha TaxID=104508 RepID=A0AAU9V9Q6_EUPED|nr:unnamed protein product [Euphydryas editha]